MKLDDEPKKSLEILILISGLDLSGPSKGAVALLHGLLACGVNAEILPMRHPQVNIASPNLMLAKEKHFLNKLKKIRKYLKNTKFYNKPPVIISFCFQADVLALMAGDRSRIISSVRGNLYNNYSDDFGFRGMLLAFFHYQILRSFPVITALNGQMKSELLKYSKNVELIPNFIDEINISLSDQKPDGSFKFVFVGSLTRRKAVIELIHSFMKCAEIYPDTKLYILGDGPLKKDIQKLVSDYQASKIIKLYGFVADPLPIVKRCDVFVLASHSEGISRAAMEALYLGKRCIMQSVDGNAELILTNKQGKLIDHISNLSEELIKVRSSGREADINRLPSNFRQNFCIKRYISVLGQYFNSRI